MEFDAVLLPPRRAESVARGYWLDRTINDDLDARLAHCPDKLALTAVRRELGEVPASPIVSSPSSPTLSREPSSDRLEDLGRAQEIEVIRAAHDPAPRRGDRERALGVFMVAKRAGDRDEPIPDRSIVDAARCLRRGCGDRMACDTRGQRNDHAGVVSAGEAVVALPILVDQRAVAKVGDARAAQAGQAIERGRVGNRSDGVVDPRADPLERRSVMRRSEKDELSQRASPCAFESGTVLGVIRLQHAADLRVGGRP